MASIPTRISVCTASGLSTTTTRRVGGGGSIGVGAATSARGHWPNARSAAANASGLVTSPTIARIMLFGTKYRLWNACRSSRVMRASVSGVPLLGRPYGWNP